MKRAAIQLDEIGESRPSRLGSKSGARLRLRLTATAESLVRRGHPWVFAASVREQNRPGITGDLAVIYDRADRFLAVGLYEAESPIAVRVLHRRKPAALDATWWRARLEAALKIRSPLFDAHTTGYRLINGESDGWPGLVMDRYGETLVVKLYAASWLGVWNEVLSLFKEQWPQWNIVLRLSRNIQTFMARHRLQDGQVLTGDLESVCVTFLENSIRFQAQVREGQKTGFFLDQRENRARVERLAAGKRVLNAFCFTGGFSLYAARGGATEVTNVDVSDFALRGLRENLAINTEDARIRDCPQICVKADAFEWLGQNRRREFDLIILDPPSLAKRESERAGAIQAYHRLASQAVHRLKPGGILVASSCSAHVADGEFFEAVRTAVRREKRAFEEIGTTGHAMDHPATFDEARYLKCIYLRVR